MEHAPEVEDESTENVTGLPEPPPVADTVYVPPTVAFDGGVEVKVIVCDCWVITGSRATIPVTANDTLGLVDHVGSLAVPAVCWITPPTAVCEYEEFTRVVKSEAPLGGMGVAVEMLLPSPKTRRSPATVVVAAGGIRELTAPEKSTG